MKRCREYVGLACLDFRCPIVNAKEHEEKCTDAAKNCMGCFYYNRCKNYVGLPCFDGHCPVACAEEYEKVCVDVIKICEECPYYEGCDNCVLFGAEDCCTGVCN